MARPRKFDAEDAIRAAREVFWERGYEAASLGDLEGGTGLNRSSIYQAFESKRALFDEALRSYIREIAEPRLAVLTRPEAGVGHVEAYLRHLADELRASPTAARGCLMVNSIAELATRDPGVRQYGLAYRDQIEAAFGTALRQAAQRGEIAAETAPTRARILLATVIGVLLIARLNPDDAAELASTTADEVATWRRTAEPPLA